MSDSKNTSSSQQETVTITKEVPKKITELEGKLAKKDQEIQEIKQKTSDAIKRIKEESKTPEIVTNLPARIIKQNTFGGHFHNGYADGTVKKATKELRATQRKASVGK